METVLEMPTSEVATETRMVSTTLDRATEMVSETGIQVMPTETLTEDLTLETEMVMPTVMPTSEI